MKWLAVLVPIAVFQPAVEPSLELLLDRVSAYLLRYEPIISEVIADEDMTQWDRADTAFSRPAGHRRLRSEMAFMRLPGDGEWIGFRLVQHVDGRSVRSQQERLQRLLAGSGDDQRRGVAIALESGSYNLGPKRTTNMPLLAFEFLHPRNRRRLTFELRGRERVDGRTLRRIDFAEHESPTIIRTPAGGDMRAHGTLWIDEATAVIRQTLIRDADPFRPFQLRVAFVEHATLGILVPARMWEVFPVGGRSGEGDARYSNFRRFTTSGRIVPH